MTLYDPNIKEISWQSVVRQLFIMGLMIMIYYLTGFSKPFIYGLATYTILSFILRTVVPRSHNKGVRLIKKEKYDDAIQCFQMSINFFNKNKLLDKFGFIFLLNSSTMTYEELGVCNIIYCLCQSGERTKAVELYRESIKRMPIVKDYIASNLIESKNILNTNEPKFIEILPNIEDSISSSLKQEFDLNLTQKNKIINHITLLPEPIMVFFENVEEHSKYLFPLFTIDLRIINPLWNEKLHMLDFNEDPYNIKTVETFNEYCREEMIAFEVIEGKYKFMTSFNYFDLTPDWQEWFEETKSNYYRIKKYYDENGSLPDKSNGESPNIYEQIGGEPDWIQHDATPLDPQGNKMTFICRVYTGNYTGYSCAKDIYLFYSDSCNLAVLLYQID